jgi:hypothetical protein
LAPPRELLEDWPERQEELWVLLLDWLVEPLDSLVEPLEPRRDLLEDLPEQLVELWELRLD